VAGADHEQHGQPPAPEIDEPSPLAELGELVRGVRAALEWQRITGAFGLPPAERAPEGAVNAEAAAAPPARPEPSELREPRAAPSERVPATLPLRPGGDAPGGLALEPEERARRLTVLEQTVRGCTACALCTGRTQTVFARGTGSSGLCFIGEGPGADEDAQGYPFVGAAGQLLDRMIAAMGLGRDEVYVCNIVKCRPPNNRKPEPEEMVACTPYLIEQLELVAPSVIVALGATAVQGLLGTSEGITRMRGKWKLYRGRIAVMPTFHPAYLLRSPGAKREVWADLQEVLKHMGRTIPSRPTPAR
jgi:DNA polymerase